MSERGTELMTKASWQLDETAELVGTLADADLRKPCLDDAPDNAGDTVCEVATHMADGYDRLGGLLQATCHAAEAPGAGHNHRHESARTPAHVSDVLSRLTAGTVPIGLLANLSDAQLDSVPAAAGRFSDGRRTLEQVIDAVIAHQSTHLDVLKRAVE